MRDGDARVCRRSDARRHPGHHLELHSGETTRLGLLASAAEHERVAALQANDAQTPPRPLDQLLVDRILGHRDVAWRLADVNELGVLASAVEGAARESSGRRGSRRRRRSARAPEQSSGPDRQGPRRPDTPPPLERSQRLCLRALEDLACARAEHALGERLAQAAGCSGSPRSASRTHSEPSGRPAYPATARVPSKWRAQMPSGVSHDASSAVRRGPLGGELDQRVAVRDRGRCRCRLGIARSRLDRERALPRCRNHLVRPEAKRDLALAAKPHQAGRCKDDPVELALFELAKARVDVAAQSPPRRGPGRAARSCERRRRLAVPIRAPSARSSRFAAAPTKASAGSSRAGTPTRARSSGISPGRSLAEWTPSSARASRNASSTVRTKRALSPTSPSTFET